MTPGADGTFHANRQKVLHERLDVLLNACGDDWVARAELFAVVDTLFTWRGDHVMWDVVRRWRRQYGKRE